MNEVSSACYACFHGHFYQPPRENPWLEAVECEPSAEPHHDWNQRICEECYRANSASRLVDGGNRILRLHNNYEWINFDFGPTLLRWLARHEPWLYDRIRRSDADSRRRFHGHGNAMAQVYNHVIMPLAATRDKKTEILWGIRDFELRFGRRPEGMWLAETAVDRESLRLMAEAGIRYTILAPHQALCWRLDGDESGWHDVEQEPIPPGRAYRCDCGRGRWIDLFFYDAGLSHGIAFGELLTHSSKLMEAVRAAASHPARRPGEAYLVLAATDGESYGHHFKFGDMALAAALEGFEQDSDGDIMPINLGAFLELHPPTAEVQIRENSSWSCAHGIDRWRADCGCCLRPERGWHQRWRQPLREALNLLNDRLGTHYQRRMGELCPDPWAVRDAYIDVVMAEPGKGRVEFLHRHARTGLDGDEQVRFFQLLEMERCALLMFTSCGWFFDDIGGLESQMILRYAARAVELAERTEAAAVEEEFVRILETAPSNEERYGNGARIYQAMVKPQAVRDSRVIASHIVESLAAGATPGSRSYYCFSIRTRDRCEEREAFGSCSAGRCRIEDLRTGEEAPFWYLATHLGGLDYRVFVGWDEGGEPLREMMKSLGDHVAAHDLSGFLLTAARRAGALNYSQRELLVDVRERLLARSRLEWEESSEDLLVRYWHRHHLALRTLAQADPAVIHESRPVIEAALNSKWVRTVKRAVAAATERSPDTAVINDEGRRLAWTDPLAELRFLRETAEDWRMSLGSHEADKVMTRAIRARLQTVEKLGVGSLAEILGELLEIAQACAMTLDDWLSQTLWFEIAQQGATEDRGVNETDSETARRLDHLLSCRFSQRLEK